MTDIVLSAKPVNNRDDYEPLYNISSLSPGEFFPTPDPSLDHIDSAILNSPPGGVRLTMSKAASQYLSHLDLVIMLTYKWTTVKFAAKTLELLGFEDRHTTIVIYYATRREAGRPVEADVCLVHKQTTFILLVLIVDKIRADPTNAEARIVTQAIAAFRFNNKTRGYHGLDPLDTMTIPCIRMSGTCPIFDLVPVTKELSNAVFAGQHPTTQTQVLRCATVTTHASADVGMVDPEYRKLALKHFLAFKPLAESHRARILEGV